MAKYAFFFTYTSESWARMISTPGDRSAVVRQVLGSVGGSLESIYWVLGTPGGIGIAEVPDAVSAAAINIAVISSGAFTENELQMLLTQDQLEEALQRAGTVAHNFQAPGG
jgi:uncharacterized protein with GYD domain